jgi:NADPH-dependent 2,4-dienoyl-CoA reductase/sulfur reductase-like enzyme
MTERLVIVGADAAGMSAAMQVRRRQPRREVVVLERGEFTSYSACGIPYVVGGLVDDVDDLVARSPERFRQHDIDVRLGHEVRALDLDAGEVEAWDHGRGEAVRIGYDQLHLATGAVPVRPPLPGLDRPFVYGVQNLDDAARLLAGAEAGGPRGSGAGDAMRVVVVGGGYIGIEMAEAFIQRGAAVTLVEGASQVMPTLDPDVAGPLVEAMEKIGIDVRLDTRVEGIESGGEVEGGAGHAGVVVAGGDRFPADLVVLGLGVRPNSGLAEAAGLDLGARGAIRVDRRQRTSAEGVWAAGDCCESFHVIARAPVHIALGTVANKQGRVAGINLAGEYAAFPGVLGTAVSRVCHTEVGRSGLSEREAQGYGFGYVTATVEATSRAGYFPDAKPVTLKALAERGSRRLIGAQVLGAEGAAKRIDVLATAMWAGMTVDDVVELDLGYAPPFGPVWDPVHIVARQLVRALDGGPG